MSSLSEDVKAVLPAADLLDHGLTQLYNLVDGANSKHLRHYPVSLWFIYFIVISHPYIPTWKNEKVKNSTEILLLLCVIMLLCIWNFGLANLLA